jgi:hypothetical protein
MHNTGMDVIAIPVTVKGNAMAAARQMQVWISVQVHPK